MRYLLLILALASASAFADSWGTPDKREHFVASVGWGAGARIICQGCTDLQATALGSMPGLIKEIQDTRRGGSGFSVKDLVADIAGAYVGQKIAWLIVSKRDDTVTVAYRTEF